MIHTWKYIVPETNVLPTSIPNNLVWIDFTDKTTLFQNESGTTPVTAFGQNIALAKNIGNGGSTYDALRPASNRNPIYTTSSVGVGARLTDSYNFNLRNILPISGNNPITIIASVSDLSYFDVNPGGFSYRKKTLLFHGSTFGSIQNDCYAIASHFENTSSVMTLGMLYHVDNNTIVSNSLSPEYNRTKYCASALYDGTSSYLYSNNKLQFQHNITLNVNTTINARTGLGVTPYSNVDNAAPFIFHQIAVFDRCLNDAELGAMHKWFMKKTNVGG